MSLEYEPEAEVRAGEEHADHPGPRQYVVVAAALALVTALEVALFYVDFLPNVAVVASLLILMTIKFALVVLWFMHLRFESPVYKRLFLTGLVLALSIFLFVMLMFGAGPFPAILGTLAVLISLAVLMSPRLRRA